MLIDFGLLFIVAVVGMKWVEIYGVPFTGFDGEFSQLRSDVLNNLDLVADLHKERLMRWIEERRDDVTVLAGSSAINRHALQLRALVRENVARGRDGDELWAAVQQDRGFHYLVQQLNLVKAAYGVYEAIHVVDAETDVVMASTDDAKLGTIVPQQHLRTSLANLHESCLSLVERPQDGAAALLISHSMRDPDAPPDQGEEVVAVLMAEVNLDDMLRPLLQTGEELGRTGEAFLVNQDVRVLTSLAYPPADGSMAMPLDYRITASPAVFAARGEEGIISAEDYRGEPVLAAYRYIPITQEMGWGMVVKRDEAEVLAPLRRNLFETSLIGFGGVIVVLVVVYVAANNLSRPIRTLHKTAQRVEAGDLGARAPVTSSDELGELANAFNSMVERIQDSNRGLEKQVRLRTQELTSVNDELRMEVAERRRAEEEVRMLNQELERRVMDRTAELEAANAELESFSYSVSHDMRAPLRAMDGFSRILVEDYGTQVSAEARRYLQLVRDNAQQMDELITDMLTLSRLGRRELRKQLVAPAELARRAVKDVRAQHEGRRVDITVGDLPPCQADPGLLRQTFVNLLDNALKFTRGREVARIEIGCRINGDEPGSHVYFVKDNGVGFDMRYADKLFGVFQRLHRAEDYEGTGVGLAIVQRVIHRHGGRIWAQAEVDRGATFCFTLDGGSPDGSNG